MDSSFEILRKLTPREVKKNVFRRASNILRVAQIRTRFDLYSNLDHVHEAILSWKRMQKFLSAQVKKLNDEYFFVIDKKSLDCQVLENVYFLKLVENDSNKTNSSNVVQKLLEEKFLNDPIDFDKPHDFLWKIAFLEIDSEKKQNDGGDYVYEFILVIHHSISSGVNANENMVMILELIEKTIRSEKIELKEFELYPGTENVFEKEINSASKRVNVPKVPRPTFIEPEKAKASALEARPKADQVYFELVDVRSNRVFATSSELIEMSKNSVSHSIRIKLRQSFSTIHQV